MHIVIYILTQVAIASGAAAFSIFGRRKVYVFAALCINFCIIWGATFRENYFYKYDGFVGYLILWHLGLLVYGIVFPMCIAIAKTLDEEGIVVEPAFQATV